MSIVNNSFVFACLTFKSKFDNISSGPKIIRFYSSKPPKYSIFLSIFSSELFDLYSSKDEQ